MCRAAGVEALVVLLVGLRRQWRWFAHLSAVVPVGASLDAGLAAHHFYDRYLYWAHSFFYVYSAWSFPGPQSVYISAHAIIANQESPPLGWEIVVVTALLLIGGGVGLIYTMQHRNNNQRTDQLMSTL